MYFTRLLQEIVPHIDPMKATGALHIKIIIKKDYVRNDNTHALYIQLYMNGKRKKIPLQLYVSLKNFNEKTQRVRRGHPFSKDYNLIIEKKLRYVNDVQVRYRLSEQLLTIDKLVEELINPTYRIDFNKFSSQLLLLEKDLLKPETYRQQKAVLNKIASFCAPLYFNDITSQWVDSYKAYCIGINNKPSTINSNLKTFKKFMHKANDAGIITPIAFSQVSVGSMKGDRTFLEKEEIKTIIKYYNSEFIPLSRKRILKQFLFSCFTGLRISDIESIGPNNFIADYLALTMKKTDKFLRIKLNRGARQFMPGKNGWTKIYAREYINRELKIVARLCGINKKISFHVSRHTFATMFLASGGKVEHLQHLMGHSKIDQTMIYVHIVNHITDKQILLMDQLID